MRTPSTRMICGTSGPLHWTTPIDRRQAYLNVLTDAGIEHDPALEADGDYTVKGGERAMTRLLAASRPPTAVFAHKRFVGIGVTSLEAHNQRRIAVPSVRMHRDPCRTQGAKSDVRHGSSLSP